WGGRPQWHREGVSTTAMARPGLPPGTPWTIGAQTPVHRTPATPVRAAARRAEPLLAPDPFSAAADGWRAGRSRPGLALQRRAPAAPAGRPPPECARGSQPSRRVRDIRPGGPPRPPRAGAARPGRDAAPHRAAHRAVAAAPTCGPPWRPARDRDPARSTRRP